MEFAALAVFPYNKVEMTSNGVEYLPLISAFLLTQPSALILKSLIEWVNDPGS